MSQMDVETIGERVEGLLDELAAADPAVREKSEELVHMLLEFYGAGLGKLLELACARDGGLLDALAADPIAGGMLALHDLHPQDTAERVTAALDGVRPYLGSHAGDVEVLGIDEQGVLRLQLTGTCDGCPSSAVTVKYAIEKAVHEAAPEITDIDVAGVVEEPVAAGAGGPVATGPGGRTLLPLTTLECPVPEQ